MAKRWHRKRAAGVRTPSMSVTPTCQNVWYRELKHPVSENKSLWMFLVLVPVSFRSSTMRDNVWGNKARSAVALCSLPVHRLGTTSTPYVAASASSSDPSRVSPSACSWRPSFSLGSLWSAPLTLPSSTGYLSLVRRMLTVNQRRLLRSYLRVL